MYFIRFCGKGEAVAARGSPLSWEIEKISMAEFFFYVTKGFRIDINNYNAFDVFPLSFPWRPFNSKVQVQGTNSKLV